TQPIRGRGRLALGKSVRRRTQRAHPQTGLGSDHELKGQSLGPSSCQLSLAGGEEERRLANGRHDGTSRSRSRWSGRAGDHAGAPDQSPSRDIAEAVAIALSALPIYGLIVAVHRDQTVRIEGAVRTETDRALAERAARVPGVQNVVNAL